MDEVPKTSMMWLLILGAWLSIALAIAWGWTRFMRGIREWEDEREERFGVH